MRAVDRSRPWMIQRYGEWGHPETTAYADTRTEAGEIGLRWVQEIADGDDVVIPHRDWLSVKDAFGLFSSAVVVTLGEHGAVMVQPTEETTLRWFVFAIDAPERKER